jgi:hypothetical protein
MSAREDPRDVPAGPSRGCRVCGLLLCPLAGLAHLLVLERFMRGTLLAACLVIGLSLVLAGGVVWTGEGAETMRTVGWVLVGITTAFSVFDVVRLLVVIDHDRRRRRRDAAFREGLAHTVRDDSEQAARCFREALCLDPSEASVRFHLGVALRRVRRFKAARRQLRRCVRWDADRAWADEARRELAAIEAVRRRGRLRRR